MFLVPHLRCILLLALSGIPFGLSRPALEQTRSHAGSAPVFYQRKGKHAFRELLQELPDESLQAVLHDRYAKYQDGVFEFDRIAIENVQDEDPPLAAQLMSAAVKRGLVKRQDGGNATTPVAESTPVPESTSEEVQATPTPTNTNIPTQTGVEGTPSSPSPNPPPVTSASTPPQPPPQSSAVQSSPDPTIIVPVTRTDANGNTVTSSILQPGQVLTSTDAGGSQVVVTTPRPTTPRPVTTIDAQGSTFVTTITPSGRLVTTTVVRTLTNAGGQPEVVTNIEVIEATDASPEPTGGDEQPPPASSTQANEPSLQTGAAVAMYKSHWAVEAVALLGGAAGIAAWLA